MLTVMLIILLGVMAFLSLFAFAFLFLTILAHIYEAMDEYQEYKDSQK